MAWLKALAMRIRPSESAYNILDKDPTTGKPFSSNKLGETLTRGAEAFGWSDCRPHRDGEWLVGHGMATAVRVNMLEEAKARVMMGRGSSRLGRWSTP